MSEAIEVSASYYKTKGRFNMIGNEQSWQVVLRASNGTAISQLWDIEDEPDIDGLPPSEVAELIGARLDSFLYVTDRAATREKVQWFRDNAEMLDSNWAKREISALERRIAKLRDLVSDGAAA